MKKQRLTKNLGLNRSENKEKIYDYIENILGKKVKFCSRGTSSRSNRYNVVHEGKNPLPIRCFNLHKAFFDNNKNEVVIDSKDGLQSYCINCERKNRRARLNKWSSIYDKMTDTEIYENYKKEYSSQCHCSRCDKWKNPEDFSISRKMDKGIHNTCKDCSKSYSESVGNRWIIYSPDGHDVIDIKKNDYCVVCKSDKKLHKDHIWPIAKGGTDNMENIQILCSKHNISKSDTIDKEYFSSINIVKKEMICKRYHRILNEAKKNNWTIEKFELEVSKSVKDFIKSKKKMTNEELYNFFKQEKDVNNRKHSIERAIRKFREYCETAILDIDDYINKSRLK